ncbi:TIGR04149 family rSAM-modified RiPP [Bacteroides sp. GM023]|uniref:TIGR04149 family rSAM-modified RiPP n=1 Tax=Bacteroides sp. GM023 TaxID=2723058 RepID=UPI00168A4CDC|nr:TIGR04149 family rSAM-modified RiPP [Bacteroides sp. GM023]MBD3588371.1 rSAM-modified peptide [Bacteroides sp. GM023]
MKKLSKLNLKDFREMSDFEMKHVLGGFGSFEEGGTGNVDGGSGEITHQCDLKCTNGESFKAYDCDEASSASACEYYGGNVESCNCPK